MDTARQFFVYHETLGTSKFFKKPFDNAKTTIAGDYLSCRLRLIFRQLRAMFHHE